MAVRPLLAGALLPLFLTALLASAGDPESHFRAEEQMLEQAGFKTDGAALLKFFRDRTLPADEEAELTLLVEQLGDQSYAVRVKATARLIAIGPKARAVLRRAYLGGEPDGKTLG
jgi:hypothetical protein